MERPWKKISCAEGADTAKDFVAIVAETPLLPVRARKADEQSWIACLVKLGSDGNNIGKVQEATGLTPVEVRKVVEEGDEEGLLRIALALADENGPLGAPTTMEKDARLLRSWKRNGDLQSRDKLPAEIDLPRGDEVPSWMNLNTTIAQIKRQKPKMSPIGALLEYFAPSLLESGFIRSMVVKTGESTGRKNRRQRAVTIRSFSWHAHLPRVAVLFSNDQVKIYDSNSETWDEEIGLLEHEFQRAVKCIEWQPRSGSGLALGCKHGICFWSNGLQWMSFLPHSEPVTSISWSPNGRFLASGSLSCGTVTVWDIATSTPSKLYRVRGNTTHLSWSPNGYYLFSASSGFGFRIWETASWGNELYTDFEHPLQAATWARDGRHLLCVTGPGTPEGEIALHVLSFPHSPPKIQGDILPMTLDLSHSVATISGLGVFTPSKVKCIAINDTNERLAVCYEGAPGVAIYANKSSPALGFIFIGHIWGQPGYTPKAISFKPLFDRGALLGILYEGPTVASSSSSIRFVPMYF